MNTEQPSNPSEKNGGQKTDNDSISRPKDPNNDPDQTPSREVKNPPNADPGKKTPGTQGEQPKR